jgi:transposase-like protein
MDDRVEKQLELLREAVSGKLDSLSCPGCHGRTVSVRLSKPSNDRVWFQCSSCEFHFSAQSQERPAYFPEERPWGKTT